MQIFSKIRNLGLVLWLVLLPMGATGQETSLPAGLASQPGVCAIWELTANFPTEGQSVFLALGQKLTAEDNWVAPPGSPDAAHDERLVLSHGAKYYGAMVLPYQKLALASQKWTVVLSQPEESGECELLLRLRQGEMPEGVQMVLWSSAGEELMRWDGLTSPEAVLTCSQLRGTMTMEVSATYRYQDVVQEISLVPGWNLVSCNLEILSQANVGDEALLASNLAAPLLPRTLTRPASLDELAGGGVFWVYAFQKELTLRLEGKGREGEDTAFPEAEKNGARRFLGLVAQWDSETGEPAASREPLPEGAYRWNPQQGCFVKASGLPELKTGYVLP
ncbi:MAG: hypothetical protein ACI4SG_02780 [Oligosphaeraceae bacterium]